MRLLLAASEDIKSGHKRTERDRYFLGGSLAARYGKLEAAQSLPPSGSRRQTDYLNAPGFFARISMLWREKQAREHRVEGPPRPTSRCFRRTCPCVSPIFTCRRRLRRLERRGSHRHCGPSD